MNSCSVIKNIVFSISGKLFFRFHVFNVTNLRSLKLIDIKKKQAEVVSYLSITKGS